MERIYSEVLYDSDNDGKESSVFREKVMKHSQLYFIVVDSDNNAFGHYHPGVISKCGSLPQGYNYDANMFLFTLNSNGRRKVSKFGRKTQYVYTRIWNSNKYFYYKCGYGNDNDSCYYIGQIGNCRSCIVGDIVEAFEGIEGSTLTGNCSPDPFTTERLIIVQMK